MIPAEAVEAANKAAKESFGGKPPRGTRTAIRAALEAAAPIILSHEADRARLERIESPWGNR